MSYPVLSFVVCALLLVGMIVFLLKGRLGTGVFFGAVLVLLIASTIYLPEHVDQQASGYIADPCVLQDDKVYEVLYNQQVFNDETPFFGVWIYDLANAQEYVPRLIATPLPLPPDTTHVQVRRNTEGCWLVPYEQLSE